MLIWILRPLVGLALQAAQPPPGPPLLQIYRDLLRPGTTMRYKEIEEDAARVCARLECPNPYLAIESLAGPAEIWYLNGFRSRQHEAEVATRYQQNAPLLTELERIAREKAGIVLDSVNLRTAYRATVGNGEPWRLGQGRFVLVTIMQGEPRGAQGSVYEAEDGTGVVLASATSRDEAEAKARTMPSGTRVFAVRPTLSMPAAEWIASDPDFWRQNQGGPDRQGLHGEPESSGACPEGLVGLAPFHIE